MPEETNLGTFLEISLDSCSYENVLINSRICRSFDSDHHIPVPISRSRQLSSKPIYGSDPNLLQSGSFGVTISHHSSVATATTTKLKIRKSNTTSNFIDEENM